eukprot:TRINITY_DN4835_c0_g1_i2.p1 TRINITY_DN4835_c0_g1~~TRINITY_DN4835_c0_g1_i2.p1  ORF type:complete len:457 (-),score=126.16 TRINITY_DN4835_c0_g1_i2:231-1472(-)
MDAPDQTVKARKDHTAITNEFNNTMLIFGGRDNADVAFNDVLKYNIINDQWFVPFNPSGMAPSVRYGHSAVATQDNKMLVFGGRNSTSCKNDVALYNMITDTWMPITVSGTPPPARWGHSAVVSPATNEMLVFGGVDDSLAYYNDLWSLNLNTYAWDRPNLNGTTPLPRAEHSAIMTPANEMVCYGGMADSPLQDSPRFNVLTRRWALLTVTGPLPLPRSQHSAVYSPLGYMTVFGGISSVSHSVLNEVWNLDLRYFNWTQAEPTGGGMFNPRAGHSAAKTPFNTFIAFGGLGDSTLVSKKVTGVNRNLLNDVGKYNLVTSVLRSTNDGVMSVVVMTIFGTILIAMCFAVDWINEQAAKERQEAAQDALDRSRTAQAPRATTSPSAISQRTQMFMQKVRENLDPLRDPSKNFS